MTFSAIGQTVTRDFATVNNLRTNTKGPKRGEKVYIIETKNLYAADFIDNISQDDGYNVIIQGNTRWKCVSCSVPTKCLTQANVTVADKLNPTINEIKSYVSSQKVPNSNGVFLNYYKKTDTLGLGFMNPFVELGGGTDSVKITSLKINNSQLLTSPIWLYQGEMWVYNDNTIVNLLNANKPSGVNYTVDDDNMETNSQFDVINIIGSITIETTTEYWDGDWQSYTDLQSVQYNFDLGRGDCDSPLYSYLVYGSNVVTMKAPFELNDLTLGKTTLAGNRNLIFANTSGQSVIQQNSSNDISIKSAFNFKNSTFSIGTTNPTAGYGMFLVNSGSINSSFGVEHNGTSRATLNLARSRGTGTSKLPVVLDDKLGSFAFTAYNGQNFNSAALLEAFVDGPVVAGSETSGQVPQRMSIVTGSNINNRFERLIVKADGSILITPVAFSALPSSGVLAGSIRVINDASTVTYRGNASGGGGNVALVMWTGSGWIYQ